MGIKLARALGHTVLAISSSSSKKDIAMEKGASAFVHVADNRTLAEWVGSCDIILNTVSASHDVKFYMGLLAKNGVIVQLGLVAEPHLVEQMPLIRGRWSIAGSVIGGIKATQEVIDFCHKHSIYPDCKVIESKDLNTAWADLRKGKNADAIRYVIDVQKSLTDPNQRPKEGVEGLGQPQ
eukprot:gnl/TRDRNA2_/TRDRNA2_168342_c0_seq1.p1 gnl/TRDRNA2_/TRDRNA2_168342_c0~~gnl/TRDRNA2_/TRDRNA2_168342_c0_seq1.p1  ORF type:complete len:195 (+),score=21.53 gnl/TRDRNA2_/TRDRNA2_168342_c0_seq1:46-585(+)